MMSDFSETPVTVIAISDIIIPPDRQRQNAKADQSLVDSIAARGLINPIIIRQNMTLVAGERRLDAFRQLRRDTIPVRIFEQLSPRDAMLVELQENLQREQLSWQDEVRAIQTYHEACLAEFAAWTQQGTATDVGLSGGHVSRILIVAKHLDDPDVAGAVTLTGAFNLIENRADRAIAAATARGLITAEAVSSTIPNIDPNASKEDKTAILLESMSDDIDLVSNATSTLIDKFETAALAREALENASVIERNMDEDSRIQQGNFIEWIETYTGAPFDVIHCDFPYGKNYSGSNTRKTGRATTAPTYADGADVYFALVDAFLANQDKIALPSAHCIFWFDMLHYCWTVEQFTKAGWRLVQPHPLVWTKNYQGVAADPQRRPRHCYETALMFSRGDRRIRKLDQDYFEMRVPDDKLHISSKPVPMLKHFLQLVVDEHTAVFDPTCGSGTALAAAGQLKASRIFGLELEPSNVDIAKFTLKKELPDGPA